jgi:hypothetical protein
MSKSYITYVLLCVVVLLTILSINLALNAGRYPSSICSEISMPPRNASAILAGGEYVRAYQLYPDCEGEMVIRYRFPPEPYNLSEGMVPRLRHLTAIAECQTGSSSVHCPGIIVTAHPNPVKYAPNLQVNVTLKIRTSPSLADIYLLSPTSMQCSPMFLIAGPIPARLSSLALSCKVVIPSPEAELLSLKNIGVVLVPYN